MLSGTGNEYQPKCGDALRLGSKGRYGSFHLWIFYAMATGVLISEVLCFTRNNFDKLVISELKPTLVSFYNDEELVAAKEILLKAVTTALDNVGRSADMPRIPKRVGDNRKQHTVDDLLKLFTLIDERRLSMPSFVALDLTRVPFLNADCMGMIAMMRKLESFERRLVSMEDWCVQEKISSPPAVQPAGSDHALEHHVSSRVNATRSSENSDEGLCDDDIVVDRGNPLPWTEVARRHRPKKPRVTQSTQSENNVKKRSKLLGTSCDGSNKIKSGVEIVRKAVIHIDNLDVDCTAELLKEYLLSKDISVITCYSTKSWLREGEKDRVTAFRVCVPADHRSAVMDANLWSKGIILRDWQFKGKSLSQHGAQSKD